MKERWKRGVSFLMIGALVVGGLTPISAQAEANTLSEKQPAQREDESIVYFVDCGDYVVNTVSSGDQFGTHNSVTDQVWGEDSDTKYQWGIVDSVSNPLVNGSSNKGGIYTDWTWAYESNAANADTDKKSSNRYTKNHFEKNPDEDGIRKLDYKFELEAGEYSIELYCTDPWGCSKEPTLILDNTGKTKEGITQAFKDGKGRKFSAGEVIKEKIVMEGDGELTVGLRSSGDNNLAINVSYIQISDLSKIDTEKLVKKDMDAIYFASQGVTDQITLPVRGENGSVITWKSSNESLLSHDGVVNRPEAGQADEEVVLTATVVMDDSVLTKDFYFTVFAKSTLTEIDQFSLSDVEVSDSYFLDAQNADVEFLKKFDTDRLLAGFRETANLDMKGKSRYIGWENSRIGGHCVGHYLTASAQAIKVTDDEVLKEKIDQMVTGLKECQTAVGTGFIFGATLEDRNNIEKQFDRLEQGNGAQTWVPWYTMHKLVAGLVDIYKYTGNEEALEVAENLGTWVYNRVSKWNDTVRNRVLGVEYGGMNDCLYELYKYSKDTKHRDAAHIFDETALFDNILSGNANTLNGRHANTTIPKFMGALNRYIALDETEGIKEDTYLEYAVDFWDLVVEKHVFITGGASDMEHFRGDNALDASRTQCTCESCCAHNMLKLSRELFKITGEKKYSDYYENTLRNSIMAAINEDGGFGYFMPMATGYYKTFGTTDPATNMFWCCTGSGMENFTKLGDSIYFHTGDALIVNQYIASKVEWEEKGITLIQDADVTTSEEAQFTVECSGTKNMKLYLRVPDWIASDMTVKVNGENQNAVASAGYICIDRTWENGDTVSVTYPMDVTAWGLPDNNTVYGFKYGPTVLAAKLGRDHWGESTGAGVDLTAPLYKVVGPEKVALTIPYGATVRKVLGTETLGIQNGLSTKQFMENINDYLVRTDDSVLEFQLKGTDAEDTFGQNGLTFVPYNTLNDERYGIYWYFAGEDGSDDENVILNQKEEGRLASSIIDSIQPGYAQYENDDIHQMDEQNSTSQTAVPGIGSTRKAEAGGYFAYNMIVDKGWKNYVLCQFAAADNGKTIKITAGDKVIAEETLSYEGNEVFYKAYYEIPEGIVKNADKLTIDGKNLDIIKVRFEGIDGQESARVVSGLYTTREYNNDARILEMTSPNGTVYLNGTKFVLPVASNTSIAKVNVKIADASGLLYVDEKLVYDTKQQLFKLSDRETEVALLVYGEDHASSKAYTLTIIKDDKMVADYQAAAAVSGQIDKIGTVSGTNQCKAKIDAARKAYNNLSAKQKELVGNYNTLLEAEKAYEKIIGEKAVKDVVDLINSIGNVTSSSKAKIDAARKAYDKLTDEQKKSVTNYSKLTAAEKSYADIISKEEIKKGNVYTVGNYKYKVTNVKKATVTLVGVKNKGIKKIGVQDKEKIKGKTFKVTAIGNGAFKNCKKATGATIGKNVKTIGNNAFSGCVKLQKVKINSTALTKIGKKAFYNCKKLSGITIKSTKLTSVKSNAFKGIHKNAKIKVPKKKWDKYKKVLKNKGQAKSVKIVK